jgi:hypothetical protein
LVSTRGLSSSVGSKATAGSGRRRRGLDLETRPDGERTTEDAPAIVPGVSGGHQLVQLLHRLDAGHRDKVAPAESPDLAFDASFLVGAVLSRDAEEAVEAVVGAQGDEPLGLLAVASPQHPNDGGLEVVVADATARHPAKVLEGPDVAVEEHLLGLVQVDAVEAPAGGRQAHDEHPALGEQPVQVEADAAEVDLRLLAEGVVLGHSHLPQNHGLALADLGDVTPHGRLADVGAVFLDQALPDAPSGVALLLGRVPVGLQPAVDRRLPGVEHRRHSWRARLPRRRDRRRQRLAHRAPVRLEPARQSPDR